ncbi:hypothetical protein PTE30175_00464 [Pandoraea terrae]|uniref:Phasin domain-containing protein n=1 Tax=Pandoraea terrae TaxID=1537710 RepID=A0A5E4S2G1_9BURK|nr:phasin family protein [Pandoraea terrae]VVD68882.1 hypothetical protein PTE30175_00464 [Pandoraea terrae]
MVFNVSSLRDIHQANVNLGLSISNVWLENMNRARALALNEINACAASVHKTLAAIADAKDLATLAPLQAELVRQQVQQSNNFWQNLLAQTQGNQSQILDDLSAARQRWQDDCGEALERMAEGTPMAHVCQQITGAAGMTYQPLSVATQQMFDLAKATLNSLQPFARPGTAPAG